MEARRQAENRVDFFPVAGVPGRQRRTEPERSRRQKHVLKRDCIDMVQRALTVVLP